MTVRRVRHDLPRDPALSVPPAVVQASVPVEREDVDPIRVASRGCGLAGERAAQRLPLVPALAVPVPIAKLAVIVDGEELALSAITPRRDGRAPLERAAK